MRPVLTGAAALTVLATLAPAQEAELRLSVPPEMVESGFLQHLLPRFKFKHRIAVAPVTDDGAAEIAFAAEGAGTPIFQEVDGGPWYLVVLHEDDRIATFRDWLRSTPGQAAIEGFPADGPAVYSTEAAAAVVVEEIVPQGDAVLGARLALVHCGRCHVVDERNRMGGIGSTPSFAALRGRDTWSDLFLAFWSENPHPSFTEVIGVTEAFDENRVAHVAPVRVTLEEIDAITAFVETLAPKDLGKPVQSR